MVEVQFGYSVVPCWLCSILEWFACGDEAAIWSRVPSFCCIKLNGGPGNETNSSGSSCLLSQLTGVSYAEKPKKR